MDIDQKAKLASHIDTTSGTWQSLGEIIRGQIESLRDELEAQGLASENTEFLRGRIRQLRDVLELPKLDPEKAESFRKQDPFNYHEY